MPPRLLRWPVASHSGQPTSRTRFARSRRSRWRLRVDGSLDLGQRTKDGNHSIAEGWAEVDRDGHANPNLFGLHPDEVRKDSNALFKFDQHSDHRILEGGILWVMEYRVAVDGSPARKVGDLELQRVTPRAHWAWRVTQPLASRTPLRHDLPFAGRVPKPMVVLRE